ncbi:MAG: SAM-dependent methyltransferase [Planctomycetota bacterium]|jgi:SAM-dependent methyltransferase
MSSTNTNVATEREQASVMAWFDHTYETAGFKYLRPLAAYPIFLQLVDAKPDSDHLDVACGPGLLLKASAMRGLRPTGIDVSQAALDIAAKYVPEATVKQSNAEQLPFESNSFDYVTCVGAIERFLDRRAALLEMIRVGRQDAHFCFMVRNASTLVWRVWRQLMGQKNKRGHQDALEIHEWEAMFAEVGLEVVGVYADQWPRQKLRRLLPNVRNRPIGIEEKVATPILPMRYVNEFIFTLRKQSAPGS